MSKCPVCGATLEDKICSYCGYTEKEIGQSTTQEEHKNTNQNVSSEQQQPVQQVIYVQQPQKVFVAPVSKKSKAVALVLCIFFGEFGFHKFYVGKIGSGLIYLFTFGIFGIGWIVDIFKIATGSFKDKFDLPLKQ